MLTKEQAAEELSKVMVEGWHEKAIVLAVGRWLGRPAAEFFGRIDGSAGQIDRWEAQREFRVACEELSKDPGAFELLVESFPKLEREIRSAWSAFAAQPYQVRHDRKPFRAPSHDAAEKRRVEWFHEMLANLHGFDQDVVWLAGWNGALEGVLSRWTAREAALPLLIAALDGEKQTSDKVFEVLKDCATGRHEVGMMSSVVIRALLGCSRPDAWEFMEKTLLSAQREEGLRQSILESAGFSHPQAFRRMLRLIVDENLVRFSATVRAVDVWFGFMYDSMAAKHAEAIIESVLQMLDDEPAREAAFAGKDGEKAYLALWCLAFENADRACDRAARVLAAPAHVEVRFAAVHLLTVLDLPAASEPLRKAMQDSDLRVAMAAFGGWSHYRSEEREAPEERMLAPENTVVYVELGALVERLKGAPAKLSGSTMPWISTRAVASDVLAEMVRETSMDRADGLVSHLEQMDSNVRRMLALTLAGKVLFFESNGRDYEARMQRKKLSPAARRALLVMLGDASKEVRETAAQCFAGLSIAIDEVERLEELLERKAGDIRTGAIARLLKQEDDDVIVSAERLLRAKSNEQRDAGLELIEQLVVAGRSKEPARHAVSVWHDKAKKLTPSQKEVVDRILSEASGPKYRLIDCLGLLDDTKRIAAHANFSDLPPVEIGERGLAILHSLDDFAFRHRENELPARQGWISSSDSGPVLLGSEHLWGVASANARNGREMLLKELPDEVRRLLDSWAQEFGFVRSAEEEMLCAWLQLWCANAVRHTPPVSVPTIGGGSTPTKMPVALQFLLDWCLVYHCETDFVETLLGWAERASRGPASGAPSRGVVKLLRTGLEKLGLSGDSREKKSGLMRDPRRDNIHAGSFRPRFASDWTSIARSLPLEWSGRSCSRFMNLVRLAEDAQGTWEERLIEAWKIPEETKFSFRTYELRQVENGCRVLRPDGNILFRAWIDGGANGQDLCRWALLPRYDSNVFYGDEKCPPRFGFLSELFRHVRWNKLSNAGLEQEIDEIWNRAVEVELARGDAPTEVSGFLADTGPWSDATLTVRVLATLGRDRLVRGYVGGDGSKSSVFSSLIQNSKPSKSDSLESFAELAKKWGVPEKRLIDLALYAPQWARSVEHTLGWDGFEDGVWWIRAHTKDSSFQLQDEVRDLWDACIAERSPVSKDDFQDGAVDVEWFRRVHEALGKKRWEAMYDAAKFACGGAGHKRAQLFADALLGNVTEKELIARIDDKRHQDSVRALGLVDLGKGAAREKRVLARYQLMQEFRRTSRKHGGSMLQASEKRAVEIGMENLARAAGYADPLRLQWAMETRETADLADGPVIVKAGDVQVSLRVNEEGVPEVEAVKKGKALASVPPGAKKLPAVKELTERATQLRRQASRMRLALEQAMCRGDEFEASELKTLWSHPVLRPMLSRVVFVGDGLMGYPDKKGAVLRGHDGEMEPLKGSDRLRIAHPVDFLRAKSGGKKKGWELWQRECFSAERMQPFKQVFRELYVLTEAEKEKTEPLRYQGQQVQPRQALALFGARGWIAKPEEGVQRTFYQEKVTVHTAFEETFYTPADIEGLTMRGLVFVRRGKYEPLKLSEVPERVFSEVMRDLDLVVSVAHRGMTDPEASQSSIEMRAALLREVCAVLKLDNVRIELPRAMIKGEFGEYALHLGSANVQRLPGGSLLILPVHSQHRGRVFLPFADDDPKCAEVMSKVLMLARDSEIRDPGILEQLRG